MAILRGIHPGRVTVRVAGVAGWSQSSPYPLFSPELANHLARKAVSERARIGYERIVVIEARAEGSSSVQRAVLPPGSAIVNWANQDERTLPTPDELSELGDL